MKQIDLSRVDLNLLQVLAVLVRERHVTRAAARLGLGQSAVSHALARLRALLDDELFVRSGRVMEPTARALALMEGFAPALEAIEATLRAAAPFEPARAEATWRVGLTDDLQIAVLPALARRIRAEAPKARLVVLTLDYRTAADRLEAGDVSAAMTFLRRLPAAARTRTVRTCGYRVLRADHASGALDLDAYCRRRHVLVTYAGDLRGIVDDRLAELGRSREVVLSVAQFGTLPALLAGTDLLATVPDYAADALAAAGGLRSEPLPFASPTYPMSLAWRAASDGDPAEQWIRRALLAAVPKG